MPADWRETDERLIRCGELILELDFVENYQRELDARAVIKPKRNSRPDTRSPARRRAVEEFLRLGYEAWAGEKGYGRRWMAETAFSTFKRMFGEHSLAQTMDNITRELVDKVSLYNMLVNI